jgi:hypothetical protein
VNAKLKTALDHLLKTADEGAGCIDDPHSRVASKLYAAVDAVRKLVNPPVRFLWTSPGTTSLGRYYRADVGGFVYHVERNGDARDTLGWSGWVGPSGGPEPGGPEQYMGVVHPTLAAAKQACVDYGIAHRRPTT